MIITPKYKIKQESLDDFSATIAAKPNLSKAEIFKKFPEFNNDEGMLQAVMDYHATAMSGKYKDLETLNSRFPELQFDYVKKKPESDVQFLGQVDLLQNSGNGSQPISQEPPKESELMDNGLTEEADKQKALQDLADQAKQQGIPEAKVVDQPPFPGQVDLGKPVETGLTAEQDFEKNKERNPAATLGKTLWNTMRYQLPADLIGGQMALEDLPKDLNEAVFNPVFNKLDDKSEPTNTESPGWLNKVMSFITHKPTEKEKADMEARRGEPSEIDLHRKQMLSQALDLKKDGNEANKYLVNSLGKADDFLDYMNWAGAAIGQGVGQIPTAVATKGASAFGQEIGTIYLDGVQELAKEKGTSPEEIIKSGQDESIFPVLFGFGAGALDLIGAKGVMKSFSKDQVMKSLRERGLGFLKVAGKESLTEGGQSILEQLGVKKAAGQTWEEAFKSIDPKDIAESMAQGFVAGGGLHAIGSGVNNLSNKKSQDNAVQEPSTGSILQQPQEGTGGEGSQRSGVEPSQQWNQLAAKEEPVKVADDTKKEKVDEPVAEPKTETQGVVEGGTDGSPEDDIAKAKKESKKQADELAVKNGFDNASHLLNSVEKRTGKKYDKVQDVPEKVIKSVVEERAAEKNETGPSKPIFEMSREGYKEIRGPLGDAGMRLVEQMQNRGEYPINIQRVIERARKIQAFDKKPSKGEQIPVEMIAEALQYETDPGFNDLRDVVQRGGFEGNQVGIERMLDVGVPIPEDILDEALSAKQRDELLNIGSKASKIKSQAFKDLEKRGFVEKISDSFVRLTEKGNLSLKAIQGSRRSKGNRLGEGWDSSPVPLFDKTKYAKEQLTEKTPDADNTDKVKKDYKMSHKITRDEESTTTLDDMTKGGDLIPDDFYKSPHFYADTRDKAVKESLRVINKTKGKPDAEVTIYRAVPKGVTEINHGDWVSLSPTYAKQHGLHAEDSNRDMPLISMKVKAKDVVWDGNDVNEFAYFKSEDSEAKKVETVDVETDPVVQKSAADQKIESGKQKVAKGVESLVAKLGAIKNVNPLDDTSAWDDIKSILDGLSDMGIAKTEQVIEYLKKELGKHGIKPEDIDAKKDQIEAHLNPPFVKEQGKKSLLGRAHEGTTKEEVKASIEKHGLNYEPESFIHAKDKATKFIEDVGFDAALEAVRKSQVEDGAAAFVWSELIDQVGDRIAESKDDAEKSQLVDMEGELLSEFDRKARSGGRFISALQDVYANSDFGYKLSVQVQQYKDKNNGVISPEVEAKFKELDTQLTEAKEKRAEAEKRAQKAEEDLAIANIKEAAAREKTKKVSSVRIKAARDTRDKLKSEFFSLYNPAKSGGKLMASAVPGATLLQYGVKIANTYVQEGIVRLEDVIAKTKEYFEKELGHALSDADLGSIQAKVSEKLNRLIEKEGKIKIYHDTIRDLVASGVDTIEGLTTAVKDLVKDTHPNVTDREIRDAITGYGRVSNPNQEEIEVQIRKMTRVGRVISAMEDIKEKKRPLRSGQQRDRLDAEERSLNKELRAAMRDLPMDEEAEAEQLKNSLDAIKTRLRNHIEDLEREIETGQKSAKARGVELDEDAKKIEAERDQIKEIHESIFGKGTDKDQRIEATLRATERAITETIRRIDQNDLESKKAGKWSSPDVVAARERLGRLKDRLLGLQEEAGIPERNRLEAAKKRATKKIEDLNERLRTGNFAKRPKPTPLVKDTELSNLDAEIVRIKEEYAKEQYKVELKNRTKVQKAVDALVEVWGLSRVLRATGEFSFVLIQNWIYTISHPITAAKAVATAFNHFISPEKSEKFLNHIRAQEYYPRVKATKLAIAETDVKLSAREEMFIGSWGNKLWDLVGYALTGMGKWKPAYEKWKAASPLKAFERAGTGFLNTVRLTRYLEGEEMLRMQGKDFNSHPEEYKDLADVVNTFTGRASLGPFDRIATPLAVIFFSPRNWASILKQATPYAFYHFGKMTTKEGGVSVAQKMAMADYLKAVSATTAIMMLIEYGMSDEDKEKYGVSIEMDPRSTDFMKVKIGKTRLDPWGGRQQMIVLQARLIMNSLKNDKGQVKTLGEDQHTSTGIDLLGKMAKNKLAPSTGLAFKFLDKHNKNIKGKNVWVDEYGNELFESPEANLYPIYAETVAELYKDQPELIASMITFMSFWGLGSQTYDNMDTKKKKMEFYKRKFSE